MNLISHFFSGVVINFELPEYSVRESDGTREVCARVAEGTLQRDLLVTLSTQDSAAIGKSIHEKAMLVASMSCIITN